MSGSEKIIPKGPTHYDLKGMPDEEFESLVARLIRIEFSKAVKPAQTGDGGADMALPGDGNTYERCWQSKHFPGAINWTKCKTSFEDAVKHWNPSHYTFCFPRDLTITEQKTFDKHFRNPGIEIEVDYWNGEELQARLIGSDEGQRVAQTFFQDVELDRMKTYQAIEAGGRLDTVEDGLDRLSNIGGFLAGKDAFFSYPAVTHEADGAAPGVTPGSVMSVGTTKDAVTSRFDVVPRDAEAMEKYGPQLVLEPSEGEKGRKAAELLEEALREGKEIEIGEGIDLRFTRLPPGMDDIVGTRMTDGVIKVGAPQRVKQAIPPWEARVSVSTDLGKESLDVTLTESDDVPEDWDGSLTGEYGGLTVASLFRWREGRGEITWNFRYTRDDSPVRDQLAALQFFHALGGTGEIVITDRGGSGRPEMRDKTPARGTPDDVRTLLAFLEDLREIEKWADVEFEFPDEMTGEQVRDVAIVADTVRRGGRSITWHNMGLTFDESEVGRLEGGGKLRLEQSLGAKILGIEVELGRSRIDFGDYRVASKTPLPDQPGYLDIRIEPADGEGAPVFEHLLKNAVKTKRPPPPPRKGKGSRKPKRKSKSNKSKGGRKKQSR